jgi:hypothetical protein
MATCWIAGNGMVYLLCPLADPLLNARTLRGFTLWVN